MTRVYAVLAAFAVLSLVGTVILGLAIGDLHHEHDPDTLHRATVHRLAGMAAALVVVFVNSISVTYFIGTSRWVREVAETYHLDPELVRRSAALKRRTFPWSTISMLVAVGIIALGGAADPGTGRAGTEAWVMVHFLGALAGLAVIAWSFVVQWGNVAENHHIIDEVMQQVRRLRSERGLEVE